MPSLCHDVLLFEVGIRGPYLLKRLAARAPLRITPGPVGLREGAFLSRAELVTRARLHLVSFVQLNFHEKAHSETVRKVPDEPAVQFQGTALATTFVVEGGPASSSLEGTSKPLYFG
jgi:hypothetical protein